MPLPLIDMLEGLKPNTRKWAEYWIQDGAPDAPYAEEHHMITAALRVFRKAYHEAADEEKEALRARLGSSNED